MSRLIIKNLPRKITKEKVKQIFSEYGTITDVKLSHTKDGKFRGFAFVGFKEPENAERARTYFHNSLILNQKVAVEICKDFQHIEVDQSTKVKVDHTTKNVVSNNVEENVDAEVTIDGGQDKTKSTMSDADFLKIKKHGSDNKDEKFENRTSHDKFVIRMRGAPAKLSEKHVTEFFYPLVPSSIKLLKGKSRSGALVGFLSEKDLENAVKLNGDCVGGKAVKVQQVKSLPNDDADGNKTTWQEKMKTERSNIDIEEVADSGRLFVRNLAYICIEDDLEKLFGKFGPLSEIHIPIDSMSRKNVGIGFITFMFPEHAIKALNEIDGTAFQGRMIHVLPAKAKPEKKKNEGNNANTSSYKKEKEEKEKKSSQMAYNWNSLFIGTDAVAGAIAEKYNISKGDFFNAEEKESTAVRVALGETQIVQETRQFLLDSGISLDSFSQANSERSKSAMLAKNLPAGATAAELRHMFEPHGDLGRVLLAPAGVTAVIEFLEPSHARQAFVKQAYRKFHHKPLFLEWAPVDIFSKSYASYKEEKDQVKEEENNAVDENENQSEEGATLFVKNINFSTNEEDLKNHFVKCGPVHICTISKKKTHKKEELLSMGYGFVQYFKKADAEKALKNLQNSHLDGHQLELKISNHATITSAANPRKKQKETEQVSTKILVRNVPFQADRKELTSLFKTFGEIKSVRLPKKLVTGGESGTHRGFAFVDFITKHDAKKAFEALCHSTHLYGRRLVLEWAENEEDTLESLRRKTAERFHGQSKKFKPLEEFEKALIKQTDDS